MISCSIDISNRCNNRCSFCVSEKYLDGTFINFDLYVRLLHSLHEMGVKSLVFSGGGEPTLHPNFKDIIEAATAYGFRLGMITNGIELDQYFDLLKNFVWVKVSLDSGSRETYKKIKGSDNFGRVIRNILRSVDKTFINVGYVLTRENCGELFDLEYLLKGVGAVSVKRNIYDSPRIMINDSCKVSDKLGVVTADCKVYYCPLKRWNKNYLLGDLTIESIPEIWERRAEFKHFENCSDCRFGQIKHKYFV